MALLIVYGSLYPFQFVGWYQNPLTEFFRFPRRVLTLYILRDVLVNIAIYLPLGLLTYLALPRRTIAPGVLATAAGAALSLVIEGLQSATINRVTSILDLVCNIVGAGTGALAGAFLHRIHLSGRFSHTAVQKEQHRHWTDPAALGVCVWGAVWLTFPCFPVLGRTTLASKLDLFLTTPASPVTSAGLAAATMLVGGQLLQAAGVRKPALWLCLSVAAIPGQLLIFSREPRWTELAGAATGMVLFTATAQAWRPSVTAMVALALLLGRQLAPFQWQETANPILWMPFTAALKANWEDGLLALIEKFFYSGAAIWALTRAGAQLRSSTFAMAALIAISECAQIRLPGRFPELIDPFLPLAAGVALKLMQTPETRQR